jgi:hypothetical protein
MAMTAARRQYERRPKKNFTDGFIRTLFKTIEYLPEKKLPSAP